MNLLDQDNLIIKLYISQIEIVLDKYIDQSEPYDQINSIGAHLIEIKDQLNFTH